MTHSRRSNLLTRPTLPLLVIPDPAAKNLTKNYTNIPTVKKVSNCWHIFLIRFAHSPLPPFTSLPPAIISSHFVPSNKHDSASGESLIYPTAADKPHHPIKNIHLIRINILLTLVSCCCLFVSSLLFFFVRCCCCCFPRVAFGVRWRNSDEGDTSSSSSENEGKISYREHEGPCCQPTLKVPPSSPVSAPKANNGKKVSIPTVVDCGGERWTLMGNWVKPPFTQVHSNQMTTANAKLCHGRNLMNVA